MIKKRVEKRDGFSVDIYRKKDNKAEVVFRKNKALYRVDSVAGGDGVLKHLKAAFANAGKADVIMLRSARGRRWAVEVSSHDGKMLVLVWELLAGGASVLRFNWQAPVEEFQNAF